MQKLSKRQKNNLIIGGLCCILLLMGIGYAAFNAQLKINGTSSISSEWKVLITDITSGSIVGSASNAAEPTHTETTATFSTNLVSPGDSITYTITVANQGSIDATLSSIEVNTGNNEAIEFETSGIEEGDNLLQGASDELYVKVTYSNSVTSQPENTTSTITVTLNYEQATGGVVPGGDTPTIGGQEVEVVTEGDGLYADEYEEGRYIYKGANPNNYITFSGETWRIISVESDGSIKIMRNESIGNRAIDSQGLRDDTSNGAGGTYCANSSYGCNAWAISDNFSNGTHTGTVLKDAELNTYLKEEYLPTLSDSDKAISHTWNIGAVTSGNSDLTDQINDEKGTTWNGKIGLITASEYLRANTNTEQCGTNMLNNDNRTTCLTTNWMYSSVPSGGYMWTISPNASNSGGVFYVRSDGNLSGNSRASSGDRGVVPVLYLSSDITLSGIGTSGDPFVIS